jgi:hypothetical protein
LQESLAPGVKRPKFVPPSSPDRFSATGGYPFRQLASKTEYRSGEFAFNECLPSPTSIALAFPIALPGEAAATSNRFHFCSTSFAQNDSLCFSSCARPSALRTQPKLYDRKHRWLAVEQQLPVAQTDSSTMVKNVCLVDPVDSFNRKAQAERDEDEEAITIGTIDDRHEQIEENPIQEDGEDSDVNQ